MTTLPGNTKKRLTVVVVAGALIMLAGGAAFAYWTSTGIGSGTATTGTSVPFDVTTTDATGGPLTPGGPTQTVGFTVTNNGTGSQNLATVAVTVANSDGLPWTQVTGCSALDYTIGPPVFIPREISPNGGSASGTVTITMNDLPSNQDACKNAVVPLYFVIG